MTKKAEQVRRCGKTGRSRVLLTQHPRPSRFSAHDPRWGAKGEKLKRVFLGYIFPLFFLASHASLCQVSSDSIIIPVLPPPCLLFVEEKIAPELNERSTLKAATFTKTGFRTVELFHAQYIVATQISNHVFQFRLSFASGDTWGFRQQIFLVDFRTQRVFFQSDSGPRDRFIHFHCLTSLPQANKAVFLKYGPGVSKGSLVVFNLASFSTEKEIPLPKEIASAPHPRMRISPDFTKLACMTYESSITLPEHFSGGTYALSVFDLETGMRSIIVPSIFSYTHPMSSMDFGPPPFDWISTSTILFQDEKLIEKNLKAMVNEAIFSFYSVDLTGKFITKLFSKRLPMTSIKNDLHLDWITGEIILRDEMKIDLEERDVIPDSFLIKETYDRNGIEIAFKGKIVYKNKSKETWGRTAVSPRKENLGYFVYSTDKGIKPTLYALLKDESEPYVLSQGIFYVWLLGWVEDYTIK